MVMFIGVTRRKRLERAKGNNYWIVAKYVHIVRSLSIKMGTKQTKAPNFIFELLWY